MKIKCTLVMAIISSMAIIPQAAELTQRQLVLEAMQKRPEDPWPRGAGHVILALPGSREMNKAYHEPGGSFSPAMDSFGVSFWVLDSQQNIKVTSDAIPLDQIRQHFVWPNLRGIPSLSTDTLYYQTIWSMTGPNTWQLQFHAKTNTSTKTMIVIRSVGPAGGPLSSIDWTGSQLILNKRWALTCNPSPVSVRLANESSPQWTAWSFTNTHWNANDGWCCARLELARSRDTFLTIRDSVPAPVPPLVFPSTFSALQMNLPDEQFVACLNAQVAHLLMGLVGEETRPGDPLHYPLNWLKPGAYVIVALARAGQLDVARQLVRAFAERDFFGGFGPEAEDPGLALWAMDEVAVRWRPPGLDMGFWPAVLRKVELIFEMLQATRPIFRPAVPPVVPKYLQDKELTLVCEPARDGLIIGKMDWQRPILFVNAASYQGLISAAQLAERIGNSGSAVTWRLQAAQLRQAWHNAFKPPASENERTYANGLWPTWITANNTADYLSGLESLWASAYDGMGSFKSTPTWTYFSLAEAHQYLYANQPDRTWQTLKWFWKNQASPGVFTWWESQNEENSFHLWNRVRGWVKPPHITPQYWTAAEMLLLQLDMLGYLDETTATPTLVVGGGIPATWINRAMSVRGLSTRLGLVDWSWQANRMIVVFRGARCPVKLGPAFPTNTLIETR